MGKNPQASMPLMEHLAELRRRLIISVVAITIGVFPAWAYYKQIFGFLREPFDEVVKNNSAQASLTLGGVVDPFTLQIQVSLVSAIVISSPIWLFQTWRFVTPGLHRNEKKWALLFAGIATPLVGLGACFAYFVMPISLQVLIGFTPDNVSNLIAVDKYFDFLFKMVLVFVIGALIPFALVLMNFAGVLTAAKIRSWWRMIVMSTLLFAAVATPTGDPLNMTLVAAPILTLIVLAWAIASLNDLRRRKRSATSGVNNA
ncbi:MAG: twin-arginine translocase subunit TatC [Actinobacteria bacterium]|nr:twin-arginine translocase subunit TatC [Actinomycetota bacterium]